MPKLKTPLVLMIALVAILDHAYSRITWTTPTLQSENLVNIDNHSYWETFMGMALISLDNNLKIKKLK